MSRIIIPPKMQGAVDTIVFDFASLLGIGETISTKSVAASVYSGTDASPSSIISGAASSSGTQVSQLITGGVVGVIYKLLCTITTSAGETLQLSAFLAVVPDV